MEEDLSLVWFDILLVTALTHEIFGRVVLQVLGLSLPRAGLVTSDIYLWNHCCAIFSLGMESLPFLMDYFLPFFLSSFFLPCPFLPYSPFSFTFLPPSISLSFLPSLPPSLPPSFYPSLPLSAPPFLPVIHSFLFYLQKLPKYIYSYCK